MSKHIKQDTNTQKQTKRRKQTNKHKQATINKPNNNKQANKTKQEQNTIQKHKKSFKTKTITNKTHKPPQQNTKKAYKRGNIKHNSNKIWEIKLKKKHTNKKQTKQTNQ